MEGSKHLSLPRGWAQFLLVALPAVLCAQAGQSASADPKLSGADETWVSLSGEVVGVEDEKFVLRHGKGQVTVEMDDWDAYNEAAPITPGDQLRVYGEIDADGAERRSVEASAVYSEKLKTYFYADDVDEEGALPPFPASMNKGFGWVGVVGTVQDIDGREMVIDTGGLREVRVDTAEMAWDPFDEGRARPVTLGTRVSVFGRVDRTDLFERREIDAESVVTLVRFPDAVDAGPRSSSEVPQQ